LISGKKYKYEYVKVQNYIKEKKGLFVKRAQMYHRKDTDTEKK
jgi:hypothetical protein